MHKYYGGTDHQVAKTRAAEDEGKEKEKPKRKSLKSSMTVKQPEEKVNDDNDSDKDGKTASKTIDFKTSQVHHIIGSRSVAPRQNTCTSSLCYHP